MRVRPADRRSCFVLAALLAAAPAARAQEHHHQASPPDSAGRVGRAGPAGHPGHAGHGAEGTGAMYGPYPMTREASGTAWQPDRASHEGVHAMKGRWALMLHGFADLALDDQGGPRGDEKAFSSNMVMGTAQRPLGPGKLGLRAMLSIEPATIGKEGYPLLLQTGETADGRTHLIDRQHPHDLFMELAATYSVSSGNRSLFVYAGLPGEPALGPPAFMHRFSGAAFPQAPIAHHWLDSSHITFGVLTAGAVSGAVKLEVSAFRGREPDEKRYDIESPKYDSHSFRVSVNPSPAWSIQASRGRLKSPEELEPDEDVDRTTVSATHASDRGSGHWESTVAWGRNRIRPGPTLDAFVAESALRFRRRHTLFARAERAEKNELFPEGDPLEGTIKDVGQVGAGYRFDFWRRGHASIGVGVFGSVSIVPGDVAGVDGSLREAYGGSPASGILFVRGVLR